MKFSSVKASTNNSSPPPRVVNPRARLNRGRGHFFFAFLALVPGSGCGSSNGRLITRIPRTIAAGKRCASDRAAASLTRSPPGNHPPTLSLFFFFFLPFLSLSLCTYSSFPRREILYNARFPETGGGELVGRDSADGREPGLSRRVARYPSLSYGKRKA